MTNQNPEPIVLTETFELNAQETTGNVRLDHSMGAPEQMKIYAVYCYIFPGYLDIGDGLRTWTDIDPVYIPVLNNENRVNDAAGAQEYAALPVCCNPRPWTDVDLAILVGSSMVPSKTIRLGAVNAKYDRTLPFSSPVIVKHNQDLYINLTNNNPATAGDETYTKIIVSLNGEIVNEQQLAEEREAARRLQQR